jgi:hypothetical protein
MWFTHPQPANLTWGSDCTISTLPSISEHHISAFTVAELGEMLKEGMERSFYSQKDGWTIEYTPIDTPLLRMWGCETEADARAKMLIYLIENKLITL